METNVVRACNEDGRLESLTEMMKNLELCQKSLNEYLDMKKKYWFWIENDYLLCLKRGFQDSQIAIFI